MLSIHKKIPKTFQRSFPEDIIPFKSCSLCRTRSRTLALIVLTDLWHMPNKSPFPRQPNRTKPIATNFRAFSRALRRVMPQPRYCDWMEYNRSEKIISNARSCVAANCFIHGALPGRGGGPEPESEPPHLIYLYRSSYSRNLAQQLLE